MKQNEIIEVRNPCGQSIGAFTRSTIIAAKIGYSSDCICPNTLYVGEDAAYKILASQRAALEASPKPTERELKLARALEMALALSTPATSLPWEKLPAANTAVLLDTIAKTAHAALLDSGLWD